MLQFPLAIMITIVAFYALELYTAFGRLEKPTYNFTNAEIDSFSTILKGGKVIIIVGGRGIEAGKNISKLFSISKSNQTNVNSFLQ